MLRCEVLIHRRAKMDPDASRESQQRSGVKSVSLPENELAALQNEAGHKSGNVGDQRDSGHGGGWKTQGDLKPNERINRQENISKRSFGLR